MGDNSVEIKLVLLKESDFSQIVKWVNEQPEDFIVQWAGLTYSYPLTIEQMMNHYSKGINSRESDNFIYKIMKSDNFIGTVQLCRFNTESREAFIGRFLIGEDLNRGSGIGKKSLRELVRIGFEDFGLKTLKLNVYELNRQAVKCYESIGFKRGLKTENVYKDQQGNWWNNIEMTLSEEDFVR